MALHPIVDIRSRAVFAHEALVQGHRGEPAEVVFAEVQPSDRIAFDQACRLKAIQFVR